MTTGRCPTRSTLGPLRTPVRGHAFASPPVAAGRPEPGARARLRREPSNPADPLAVAVWVEDGSTTWRIGYLDRGVAARVAPRLDAGLELEARVDGWASEPGGRWHRPLVVVTTRESERPPRQMVPPADPASGPATQRRRPDAARPAGERQSSGERAAVAPLWARPPGVTRRVVRTR